MSISIADNFSYNGRKAFDSRLQFDTVANMKAASESSIYDGCFSYVTATKKYYVFDASNEVDETTGKWREFESGGGGVDNAVEQYEELPEITAEMVGKVVQYVGETDEDYIHNYFYEAVSDGEATPTYSWEQKNVQPGSSGGDASLQTAVTSNLAVGAIPSGTTLAQGTTFTEFVQKILITEIAPITSFSASGSGVKEVGTSVTPTLTLTISSAGTGTPVSIKFYDGSTLLDTQSYVSGTNTYTFTMDAVTTTKTVKGVLEYKKSDNTTATIEKSATYTFVMASYYGAVTTAPTDKAGIIALTKNVKNTKAQTATFNLANQRACYCYPASMGNLSSIKDANGFDYISGYTKTNVTVDGESYNVYTQTDPVTASGFKQIYS